MSLRRDLTVLVHFFILCGGLVACLDRCGAGVGGVGVLGDSTDSDSSDGGVLLSILGEVTPAVDWSDVTSTELNWVTAELGVFWGTSSTCLLQFPPSFNWTWKEAGDDWCMTVPACHFCPDRWSRARTQSPTAISLYFANSSWLHFILSCWLATRDPISGVTRDNRVRSFRCKNSLAGDELVVTCGVLL